MHMFIFLKTLLFTKVFELAFITNRSQKSFTSTNIFLTITTNFQPFFVVLEADIRAELLDVATKPDTVLAQAGGLDFLLA